jgi:hypothetical protein
VKEVTTTSLSINEEINEIISRSFKYMPVNNFMQDYCIHPVIESLSKL